MKTRIFFIVLIAILSTFKSKSNQSEISYNGDLVNIEGKYIGVFADKEGGKEFKDILELPQDSFTVQNQKVPNLQLSESIFWAKIKVKNNTSTEKLLLDYNYPIIENASLFSINNNGDTSQHTLGYKVAVSERKHQHAGFIYDLDIPNGESKIFYLKISSNQQIMLPLKLGSSEQVFEDVFRGNTFISIYFGIIMVMFLYNTFLFFATKDRSYILYSIYLITLGFTHFSLHGFSYELLWPESPKLAELSIALTPAFSGIASIYFLRSFLNTKFYAPKIHKFYNLLLVIYVLGIVLYFFNLQQISYKLLQSVVIVLAITIMYTCITIIKKGYRPAKYFMFAWSVFIGCVIIFILKDFGILPYNSFTIHSLEIGAAFELVLISFALADRINILKQEKEDAQERELGLLQRNQEIIEKQNIVLEQKVKERTQELEESNFDLNKAIVELKLAQSQLVDAEKMASLGQLTAGIAHEINNPINFVVANITPLKRDINDILEILEKYAEIKDGDNISEKIKEIEELKEDLDLDFTLQEIEELLKGMDEGANRTVEIVKSLRTFSRLDEDGLKVANINECLDSTLMLLKSSISDKITIEKSYAENSDIECFPGKINQLFMNIINNAIHAVESKMNADNTKGMIKLETVDSGDDLIIKIIDNGIGMNEEVKKKIFDPFFTTKDIGEGTGLGLSIVHSIIEKHNAKIEVNSELGKGTEFIIRIHKKGNTVT